MSTRQSCCTGGSCCGAPARRQLQVEFLYLDLQSCTWCQESERNLEAAIAQAAPALAAMGVEVVLSKRQVRDEAEAASLGMVASPTIRINGRDIQPQVELAHCGPCSALCGEDTDCRVWTYDGRTYTAPPVAMLVQALLREALT